MLGACNSGSSLGGPGGSGGFGGSVGAGGDYTDGSGGRGGSVGSGGFPGAGGRAFGTGGAFGSGGEYLGRGGTFGTGGLPGFGGTFGAGGFRGFGGAFGTGGLPGFGGTFGAGGSPGFGGTFGAGGSPGFGGTFGAGGSPGFGGATGNLPDGGTCSAPSPGPISTSSPARPFGWTFSGAGADAATPSIAAADGGTAPASCQSVPAAYPGVSCLGLALLQPAPDGPVVVFADGARLRWDNSLPYALRPYVKDEIDGDTVWVDYEKRNKVVCPFCGTYTTETLQIRDLQTGLVRFYDQQGAVLPNLSDAQIMDIFGVSATVLQTCTVPISIGCFTYLRSQYDHQLATTPPQLIVDATLTQVTTSRGKLAVFWASSQESYVVESSNCISAPGVATDTGFVAALAAP